MQPIKDPEAAARFARVLGVEALGWCVMSVEELTGGNIGLCLSGKGGQVCVVVWGPQGISVRTGDGSDLRILSKKIATRLRQLRLDDLRSWVRRGGSSTGSGGAPRLCAQEAQDKGSPHATENLTMAPSAILEECLSRTPLAEGIYGAFARQLGVRLLLDRFDLQQLPGYLTAREMTLKVNAYDIRTRWEERLGSFELGKDAPIHSMMYIHVPFCVKRCAYCCLHSVPLKRRMELNRYLSYLTESVRFYSDAFSNVRFSDIVLGGGTPGILGPSQMETLFSNVFSRFAFENAHGMRSFEFNPIGVSAAKLAVLRKYGFNRINLGVQSLEARTLTQANRSYQTYGLVRKAVGLIREAGFDTLNIDLILGLAGDDAVSFFKSFEGVARMGPDVITVYPLLPDTSLYGRRCVEEVDRFYGHYRHNAEEVIPRLEAFANERGYSKIGSQKLFKDANFISFRCAERPRRGDAGINYYSYYDTIPPTRTLLLGLGPGAFSYLYAHSFYEERADIPFRFDPHEERWTVHPLGRDYEMLRYVHTIMRVESKISRRGFRREFSMDILDAFPEAIAALKRLNRIKITDEQVSFSVDNQTELFLCALHFVGKDTLKRVTENQTMPRRGGALLREGS